MRFSFSIAKKDIKTMKKLSPRKITKTTYDIYSIQTYKHTTTIMKYTNKKCPEMHCPKNLLLSFQYLFNITIYIIEGNK